MTLPTPIMSSACTDLVAALLAVQAAKKAEIACDNDMLHMPRGMFEKLYPKSLPEDLTFAVTDARVGLFAAFDAVGLDMQIIREALS